MTIEIHTGIPVSPSDDDVQRDLEQPLLINTATENKKTPSSSLSSDNSDEQKVHTWWLTNVLVSWTFINGFWLGFIIQTVSLGSTAILAINWGKHPISWASKQDELQYAIFFVLSQSWWLLFPVICFAIDGGLTGSGRSLFERCFYKNHEVTSREVFLGGVRFHVGIVFGCFLVWSLIDLYFGASVTVFATLFVSFVACLGLCYGMVIIHDRYIMAEQES